VLLGRTVARRAETGWTGLAMASVHMTTNLKVRVVSISKGGGSSGGSLDAWCRNWSVYIFMVLLQRINKQLDTPS
jgi:hypothetical protein